MGSTSRASGRAEETSPTRPVVDAMAVMAVDRSSPVAEPEGQDGNDAHAEADPLLRHLDDIRDAAGATRDAHHDELLVAAALDLADGDPAAASRLLRGELGIRSPRAQASLQPASRHFTLEGESLFERLTGIPCPDRVADVLRDLIQCETQAERPESPKLTPQRVAREVRAGRTSSILADASRRGDYPTSFAAALLAGSSSVDVARLQDSLTVIDPAHPTARETATDRLVVAAYLVHNLHSDALDLGDQKWSLARPTLVGDCYAVGARGG
jgi:hypothetical protein